MENNEMSRSSFLKFGLAGMGAVAAAGLFGCNSNSSSGSSDASDSAGTADAVEVQTQEGLPEGASWKYETDILICGCGTASAPAAIDAIDGGADVLLIEKASWIGGTVRRNGGGIAGAGTKVQKALGIEDSADELYEYLVACGEGYVDEDLLRVVADESGANVDWILHDLGAHLPEIAPAPEDWEFCTPEDKGLTICCRPGLNVSGTPVFFEKYGFEPKQRCHWVFPYEGDTATDRGYATDGFLGHGELDTGRGGTGIWKIFEDALTERNANIKTETELVRLITRNGKEVIGAVAKDSTGEIYIKARKAVIITTGAWNNNQYLMRTYTLRDARISLLDDGTDQVDGMGVQAAMDIGAATVNMAGGPYYGGGGLKINTNAQVLDQYGDPIPRLYASSYAVGGRIYQQYAQCGFHTMWNFIFGRHAAQHALTLDSWE